MWNKVRDAVSFPWNAQPSGYFCPSLWLQLSLCTFLPVFQSAPALRLQASVAASSSVPPSSFSSWSLTLPSSPPLPRSLKHFSPRKDRKEGFVWALALAKAFSGSSSTVYTHCGFWRKNSQKGRKLPCYGPRFFNSLSNLQFLLVICQKCLAKTSYLLRWLCSGFLRGVHPSVRKDSGPLFFLHCSLSVWVPSWRFTLQPQFSNGF